MIRQLHENLKSGKVTSVELTHFGLFNFAQGRGAS
ncbi:MAG: hypothetical protein UR65_C0073G0011 [Candidatus Moranbacteria bacterium GW2011_GWE2_35_164]|nr:MAG: hypothetical protein UR65_C0073G0011 [Candidatus Moranbacteria bacterium GW2011_GWE2_35_164]